MIKVTHLPRMPVFFALPRRSINDAIRARAHDIRDPVAKTITDVREARFPTLILDGIMQQCCNGHVFATTLFEDRRRDREEVGNVWDRCSLARLTAMNVSGVKQAAIEPISQHGYIRHFMFPFLLG
jgi:hypothetical protein